MASAYARSGLLPDGGRKRSHSVSTPAMTRRRLAIASSSARSNKRRPQETSYKVDGSHSCSAGTATRSHAESAMMEASVARQLQAQNSTVQSQSSSVDQFSGLSQLTMSQPSCYSAIEIPKLQQSSVSSMNSGNQTQPDSGASTGHASAAGRSLQSQRNGIVPSLVNSSSRFLGSTSRPTDSRSQHNSHIRDAQESTAIARNDPAPLRTPRPTWRSKSLILETPLHGRARKSAQAASVASSRVRTRRQVLSRGSIPLLKSGDLPHAAANDQEQRFMKSLHEELKQFMEKVEFRRQEDLEKLQSEHQHHVDELESMAARIESRQQEGMEALQTQQQRCLDELKNNMTVSVEHAEDKISGHLRRAELEIEGATSRGVARVEQGTADFQEIASKATEVSKSHVAELRQTAKEQIIRVTEAGQCALGRINQMAETTVSAITKTRDELVPYLVAPFSKIITTTFRPLQAEDANTPSDDLSQSQLARCDNSLPAEVLSSEDGLDLEHHLTSAADLPKEDMRHRKSGKASSIDTSVKTGRSSRKSRGRAESSPEDDMETHGQPRKPSSTHTLVSAELLPTSNSVVSAGQTEASPTVGMLTRSKSRNVPSTGTPVTAEPSRKSRCGGSVQGKSWKVPGTENLNETASLRVEEPRTGGKATRDKSRKAPSTDIPLTTERSRHSLSEGSSSCGQREAPRRGIKAETRPGRQKLSAEKQKTQKRSGRKAQRTVSPQIPQNICTIDTAFDLSVSHEHKMKHRKRRRTKTLKTPADTGSLTSQSAGATGNASSPLSEISNLRPRPDANSMDMKWENVSTVSPTPTKRRKYVTRRDSRTSVKKARTTYARGNRRNTSCVVDDPFAFMS